MTRRTKKSKRTFGFQQLEDRKLLSANSVVNVNVTLKNGSLTITGSDKYSDIDIEQVGVGQYRIFGIEGSTTTVNKQKTPQTFSGVTGDINIDLKGDNDIVAFENATNGKAVTLPRNLTLKDVGSDVLYLDGINVQGNVSISGGSGSRVIDFIGSTAAGGFSFSGGSRNNVLEFFNSSIGSSTFNDGKNDCNVKLGSGDNIVEFFNTKIERNLTANIGSNSGDLSIFEVDGATVGGNATVQTGNANDHVSLNNFTVRQKLDIETGNGNDTVALGGIDTSVIYTKSLPTAVTADQVFVDLGKGDDTFQIGGNGAVRGGGVVAGSATYLGNSGVDSVFNDTNAPLSISSFSGFEQMPPRIHML
jgi:hypothetical protein